MDDIICSGLCNLLSISGMSSRLSNETNMLFSYCFHLKSVFPTEWFWYLYCSNQWLKKLSCCNMYDNKQISVCSFNKLLIKKKERKIRKKYPTSTCICLNQSQYYNNFFESRLCCYYSTYLVFSIWSKMILNSFTYSVIQKKTKQMYPHITWVDVDIRLKKISSSF